MGHLPLLLLIGRNDADELSSATSLGETPTTFVPRSPSISTYSSGFVDQTMRQPCLTGRRKRSRRHRVGRHDSGFGKGGFETGGDLSERTVCLLRVGLGHDCADKRGDRLGLSARDFGEDFAQQIGTSALMC